MLTFNGIHVTGTLPAHEFEHDLFAGRVRFYPHGRNHVRLYVQNEFVEIFSDLITIDRWKKMRDRMPYNSYYRDLAVFLDHLHKCYEGSEYHRQVR